MIRELIEEAKRIEATTDANIQGALSQVANGLTIDDCQLIVGEYFTDDEKKLSRWQKKLDRAANDKFYGLGGLRNDMFMLLQTIWRESE